MRHSSALIRALWLADLSAAKLPEKAILRCKKITKYSRGETSVPCH